MQSLNLKRNDGKKFALLCFSLQPAGVFVFGLSMMVTILFIEREDGLITHSRFM